MRTLGFICFDSVVPARVGQAVRRALWFALGEGGAVTDMMQTLSGLNFPEVHNCNGWKVETTHCGNFIVLKVNNYNKKFAMLLRTDFL